METTCSKSNTNEDMSDASFNEVSTKYLSNDFIVLTYYGVHIPPDIQIQETDGFINVFEDKSEALKVVKKYKKARFKAFRFYHEAAEFAVHGSENPNNNTTIEGTQKDLFFQKELQNSVGEKPSQFRGPTSQNLVKLRKAIESGDLHFVQNTIWENPRYLIGVGDTPSILQEGFRYNGLHVAAKSKNHEMCELILNTISNVKFIKKLYVDDHNPEDRAKILLDLYLNTPDKGLHETPLHFAVKFGAIKCVEILVSFPQCDKNLKNKHGKLPSQIICDRYDPPDSKFISEMIALLLQDNYYVPVLRSEDNCAPPLIGEPFSPTSPLNFNTNPMNPRIEIHAYAGPMNKEGADKFRKLWKTPPRSIKFSASDKTPLSSLNKTIDTLAALKYKDPEKGLERIGNSLAQNMDVAWKEYWPFLDSFLDIASTEGLELFDTFLGQRINHLYNLSNCDILFITRSPIKSGGNSPHKLSTEISPITELCKALQACTLKENSRNYSNNDLDFCKERVDDFTQIESPFCCIDKSLQVFARRISNDILYLLDVQYDTCRVLETQIRQLQLLMASYMDDNRFVTVDFHLVHSRLSYLIRTILKQTLQDTNTLEKMLDLWLEFCSKNYDCFSSDDEGVQNVLIHSDNQHTMCVLKNLQENLDSENCFTEAKCEEDCVLIWKVLKPCSCLWKPKNNKKLFGGKRSKSFVRSPKYDFIKRLSFNEDEDIFTSKPNLLKNGDLCIDNGHSSDDEEFYTPPSTPSLLIEFDESDDDNFDETNLPEFEVFIEGDIPSKIDSDVYNALNLAGVKLNHKDYPNIYKWHHAVSLYKDNIRQSWTSPNSLNYISPPTAYLTTSTPARVTSCKQQSLSSPPYTPPKSWLRITGANSPRASLKSHKGNVSFNL